MIHSFARVVLVVAVTTVMNHLPSRPSATLDVYLVPNQSCSNGVVRARASALPNGDWVNLNPIGQGNRLRFVVAHEGYYSIRISRGNCALFTSIPLYTGVERHLVGSLRRVTSDETDVYAVPFDAVALRLPSQGLEVSTASSFVVEGRYVFLDRIPRGLTTINLLGTGLTKRLLLRGTGKFRITEMTVDLRP